MWSWPNYFISLSPSFLICIMAVIVLVKVRWGAWHCSLLLIHIPFPPPLPLRDWVSARMSPPAGSLPWFFEHPLSEEVLKHPPTLQCVPLSLHFVSLLSCNYLFTCLCSPQACELQSLVHHRYAQSRLNTFLVTEWEMAGINWFGSDAFQSW